MAALSLLLLLTCRVDPEPDLVLRIKKEVFPMDSAKIVEKHLSSGHFDIRIEKSEFNDSIELKVYAGPRYMISEVKILGSNIRYDILQNDFGLFPGNYYFNEKVEEGIKKILNRYLENGYPFCQIKPELKKTSKNEVIIILVINEGQLVKLKDMLYKGKKTRTWVVKRWLKFEPGIFSQSRIDEWQTKLQDLDYIGSTTEKIIRSGSEYFLLFEANELSSEIIEIGGVYAPSEKSLLFIISLTLDNLLGTMRKLTFNWESSRYLEASYLEPWLIYPVTIGLDFKDVWYDTQRVGRGEVSFATNFFRFYTGLERGDRNDEFIGFGLEKKGRRCSLGGFIEFVRMQPDRSHFKIGGDSKYRIYLLETIANFRHTTINNPGQIDLFQLGGINSVRGYWRDEFYFKTGGWSNIELRITDIVYPFFDIANLDQKWYYSTGIGFELMGRNFGLRAAIGIPIWEPLQTKIHANVLGRM